MTLLVVGAEALIARMVAKAIAGEIALSQAKDILGGTGRTRSQAACASR